MVVVAFGFIHDSATVVLERESCPDLKYSCQVLHIISPTKPCPAKSVPLGQSFLFMGTSVPHNLSVAHSTITFIIVLMRVSIRSGFWKNLSLMPFWHDYLATLSHFFCQCASLSYRSNGISVKSTIIDETCDGRKK